MSAPSPQSGIQPAIWTDSHCHVTADRFDEDRPDVLARATEAGVHTLMAIGSGYGVAGNAAAVDLAQKHERIFAAVGVHPHEASELDDSNRSAIREWLGQEKVVAVGECGLDYHYMNSPSDVQREVFAEQVALARELNLPVVIHVRGDEPNAYEELLEIWISEGRGELEGVLHCYTGTLEFAKKALPHGFYVSFSGIVTFKKSDDLRKVAQGLPLQRLMVETDAPFLAPQGHRGKRCEPAWVPLVGETLAGLHGVAVEEVARVTSENAAALFRLPAAG